MKEYFKDFKSNKIKQVGSFLLLSGLLICLFYFYPEERFAGRFVREFYSHISTAFLEIAITVLLIDGLYERKGKEELKKRLLRELGSEDRGFTSRALKELREMNGLADGSLVGIDLARANLSRLDLSGANLTNVNLQGAQLSETNFKNANLSGANLNGANIKNANFENCILSKTKLKKSILYASIFNNSNLVEVDFMQADLQQCEFIGVTNEKCAFEDADLTLSNLTRTTFSDCSLLRANVHSAVVKDAKFERCDLNSLQNWEKMLQIESVEFSGSRNEPNGFIFNQSKKG